MLRYVHPSRRLRSEGSAVNSTVKIGDAIFQVLLEFTPSRLINADRCLLAKLVKARRQQFFVDVMQQGCEFEVTALTSRLNGHQLSRQLFDLIVQYFVQPRPWGIQDFVKCLDRDGTMCCGYPFDGSLAIGSRQR